jgi:hypothetical protein
MHDEKETKNKDDGEAREHYFLDRRHRGFLCNLFQEGNMDTFFLGRIAAVLLCGFIASQADITMTQVTTTESMKNGKADATPNTEISTLWIAADKMRMDKINESTLLLAAKDSLYLIDNTKKSYTGISLSQIADASAKGQEMPAEMAAMMANMMKMKVTIEPTSETKTINGWKCTKYLQTMDMMGVKSASELWATTDIKVDPVMIEKFVSSMYLKSKSMKGLAAQIQKEYGKIKGYVVYSVSTSTVMGSESRTTTEVRQMKQATAPAGTFDLPAKFKQKKWE